MSTDVKDPAPSPALEKKESPTHSDEEKKIENVGDLKATSDEDVEGDNGGEWNEKDDVKLMRKVDWHLLPILCLLYGFSLIDRVNFGSARVLGMGVSLHLVGSNHYTIALFIFFIGYFLFDLPSTLLLRSIHPRRFLPFIVAAFGALTLGIGFSKDWIALTVLRAFLGVFEAGFFPACVYLISCWYLRFEVQRRLTVFYMASVFTGGFAPVLAYGLSRMEGVGGQQGWRWIFIMEGIITIIGAVAGYIFIIDFPTVPQSFLTPAERTRVIARLDAERGDAHHDGITLQKVLHHLKDVKLWLFGVMFGLSTAPAYALAYFTPVILAGLGFSAADANLLCAPPMVVTVFTSLATAWISDKVHLRFPFLIMNSCIAIIGFAVVMKAPTNGLKLFGTFLACIGTQPQIPFVQAFCQNNVQGSSKRAVASGLTVAFGSIGGIAASTVFREKDFPFYHNGLLATCVFHAGIVVLTCGFAGWFWWKNKALDAEDAANKEGKNGQDGEERVRFRYAL